MNNIQHEKVFIDISKSSMYILNKIIISEYFIGEIIDKTGIILNTFARNVNSNNCPSVLKGLLLKCCFTTTFNNFKTLLNYVIDVLFDSIAYVETQEQIKYLFMFMSNMTEIISKNNEEEITIINSYLSDINYYNTILRTVIYQENIKLTYALSDVLSTLIIKSNDNYKELISLFLSTRLFQNDVILKQAEINYIKALYLNLLTLTNDTLYRDILSFVLDFSKTICINNENLFNDIFFKYITKK